MNPSCAGGNHAAIYVECEVINWFKQIVGFPAESMGLLVSGGSMAALTGLAVARHVQCGYDVRTQGLQGASARLKFYRNGEGHGCRLGPEHSFTRDVSRGGSSRRYSAEMDS
jgi:hypothetical protein